MQTCLLREKTDPLQIRERASHIIVRGVAARRRSNGYAFGAFPPRTALRPDGARRRLCAVSAAGRIGRRRQFGDQRYTVRPGQPQRGRRPQRIRKRFADSSARHQRAGASDQLRIAQFVACAPARRNTILCRRIAADHQPASRLSAKNADPSARAERIQHVHGDLPGVLAAISGLPGGLVWVPRARLGLGGLEIVCLPTHRDRQEHSSIRVISGGRSGFFPPTCDDRSLLIAHSPVPTPAALDDDKFQHRNGIHRMERVIPLQKAILGAAVEGGVGLLKMKPPPAC